MLAARLSKMPLAVTTSLGQLPADNFFSPEKRVPAGQ